MPSALNVPLSVLEFLQSLELELKQIPGVSPEEALSDAREFCTNQTTDELRKSMHRPKAMIASILALVAASLLVCFGVAAVVAWFAKSSMAQESLESQSAAVVKLREAVLNQYSYRDLRGVDWNKRFEEFSPKLEATTSRNAFAKQAAEMLSAAQDIHIWLRHDGKTLGTFQPNSRPNFNPRLLPKLLTSLKQHGKTVLTGMANDTVHYVAIGTWDHREPASMKAALEAIREASIAKAPIIIDVRPNSGGDEEQARSVASFFVNAALPYAQHRNWSDGQLGSSNMRSLSPNSEGNFHPGPCVVLMGPSNMSSCESFLLMMRQANATLVGATSFGTSGNPKPHELGNGVTLFLPSWQEFDLDGNLMEGKGISPDVLVDAKNGDFSKSDLVLAKALEVLGRKR